MPAAIIHNAEVSSIVDLLNWRRESVFEASGIAKLLEEQGLHCLMAR
jgi:hypothetical protein